MHFSTGIPTSAAIAAAGLLILFAGCEARQSKNQGQGTGDKGQATQNATSPAPAHLPLSRFEYSQGHMGVQVTLTVWARGEDAAREACILAYKRIAQIDNVASDYRPDSELMRLCAKAGGPPLPVSDDLYTMLKRAQEVSQLSRGAFDITVGPYVTLWREARRTGRFPPKEQLQAAKALVGYDKIILEPVNRTAQLKVPGMKLDLGGIAKGYAGDEALKVLKDQGITSACYQAGGDIVLSDAPLNQPHGWQIDVVSEQPQRPSQKLLLKNCAISTSGDTYQYVEIDGRRYSHIVDPRTGIGLTSTYLVTIIAPGAPDAHPGLTSDPLSKVASVLGTEAKPLIAAKYPNVKVRFAYGAVE